MCVIPRGRQPSTNVSLQEYRAGALACEKDGGAWCVCVCGTHIPSPLESWGFGYVGK